jgi:PKD domain
MTRYIANRINALDDISCGRFRGADRRVSSGGSIAESSRMSLRGILRRSLPFVFVVFAVMHAIPGAAASVKDQAFEPSLPDTIPTICCGLRWAQTFTVGTTGTLTRADVLVAQMFRTQPEALDISIFNTSGGAPMARLTPLVHVPAASVPIVSHASNFGDYAYVSAAFALPVTAGDVLAIVVSTGQTSTYFWAGVLGGGYPGGQLYRTSTALWSPSDQEDQAFRTFVAPSRPPTANAGTNRTVRPGTTVTLDGSGSFDDNTDTSLLQYSWSVGSVPQGSAVTLTGANTMTPSFVPDLFGNYVMQLIVTDEDGLPSLPSFVTIGENLPPTAGTYPGQLVIVGQAVGVNGYADDPDGDSITYSWQLTEKPVGSSAQFTNPTDLNTAFVPDLPGVYVATVTPSDFLGAGTAASTTITAITVSTYIELQLQAAAARLQELPPSAVTSPGNLNAFIQFLSHAVVALQKGDLDGARKQVEHAISRTDGCALQGSPDGNGPGRDWIATCEAQEQVYPALVFALAEIVP